MFREFSETRVKENKRLNETRYERKMRLKAEEAKELMRTVETMSLESLKALNNSQR